MFDTIYVSELETLGMKTRQSTLICKIVFFFIVLFCIMCKTDAQLYGFFGAALRLVSAASRVAQSISVRGSVGYQAARASISVYAAGSGVPSKLATALRSPRYVGYPSRSPYIESSSSVTDAEFRVILKNLINGRVVSSKVSPNAKITPLPMEVESTLLRWGIYVKSYQALLQPRADPRILVGAQGKTALWANGDLLKILNAIKVSYAGPDAGSEWYASPPKCYPEDVPVGSYCAFFYMPGNPENNGEGSKICGDRIECFMLELECTNKPSNFTEYTSSGCYKSYKPDSDDFDWICSDNCQWDCLPYLTYSGRHKTCCNNGCYSHEYVDGCDEVIAFLNSTTNSVTILPQYSAGECKECVYLPGQTPAYDVNPLSNPCGFMCTLGYYNPVIDLALGNQPCKQCPPGTFGQLAIGSQIVTASQAAAMQINYAGICTLCPAGKITSSFAATACVSCTPGTYSSGQGFVGCSLCDSGTYTSVSAATECITCAVGTYQSQYAATTCQACQINPTIDAGSVSCPPPSAGPFRSLIPMIICPAGQYMDIFWKGCVSCSTGTYSTGIGLDNFAWDVLPVFVNTYAYAFGRSSSQCRPTLFEGLGAYCTFFWDAGASSTIVVTGEKNVIGIVTRGTSYGDVYVTEFTLQRNIVPANTESFVIPGNVGGKRHQITLFPWPERTINVTLKASPRARQWVNPYTAEITSFMWTVIYSIPPCLPCPPGTISENNVCRPGLDVCGSSYYYVQNNKCVRCSVRCPSGQYTKAACNISSDMQCVMCPTECNPGEYMISPCYNSLPPICSTCNVCPQGTFQKTPCDGINKATCQTCQACPDGKYLAPGSCNGTIDSLCISCTTCTLGQTYEISSCSRGQNRVCSACGLCPTGKYQTQSCTLLAPPLCQECTACIVMGQNYYSDPRSRFPIVTVLTPEYETAPCGGPQGDRQCKACTFCPTGKYASIPCGGTQNSICENCTTTCPANQQLVAVCLNGPLGSQNSYCSNFQAGC